MQSVQRAFSVKVRYPDQRPGLAILDLYGGIDKAIEAALHEAVDTVEGDGVHTLVLNFLDVDHINSTGIALIVALLARTKRSQRRLSVFGLSAHYEEIFHITRLADFIPIYPDEASALAAGG